MNVFNIICGPNRIYSRVDSNESEMETRETRSHVRLSATECVRVCVSVCAWTLASVHVRVCVCLQYYKFSPFLLFLFFFFAIRTYPSSMSFAIRVPGTFSFSYWTPSRCAKILIDKCATVPPASLSISVTVSYLCVTGGNTSRLTAHRLNAK